MVTYFFMCVGDCSAYGIRDIVGGCVVFMSCTVAVPTSFKYGSFINSDFTSAIM
jgi:hypothetical protein